VSDATLVAVLQRFEELFKVIATEFFGEAS